MSKKKLNYRERLVFHVQELERVEELKRQAAECLKDSFAAAAGDGFDKDTLKVVLRLRRMTSEQRRERRALEAIYMAALGMLEGEALSDEARRRLDPQAAPPPPAPAPESAQPHDAVAPAPRSKSAAPPPPTQAPLIVKMPDEARQEGMAAAAAGKRVYDNPYPAGDPCRAAWDEGWCAQSKSHGMDTPAAFQRRSSKAPEKDEQPDKDDKTGGGAGGREAA